MINVTFYYGEEESISHPADCVPRVGETVEFSCVRPLEVPMVEFSHDAIDHFRAINGLKLRVESVVHEMCYSHRGEPTQYVSVHASVVAHGGAS